MRAGGLAERAYISTREKRDEQEIGKRIGGVPGGRRTSMIDCYETQGEKCVLGEENAQKCHR